VGEDGGVAGWVELDGDAAACEDRIPVDLAGTYGVGSFVAAYPRLA
jgi:hypothetical protein